MGFEGTMICEICKRAVSVMDIRYMPKQNGRISVCNECISKSKGKSNAPQKEIKISEKQKFDIPSVEKASSNAGSSYYCRKCNYKFRSSSEHPVCGYCGRADSIEPC